MKGYPCPGRKWVFALVILQILTCRTCVQALPVLSNLSPTIAMMILRKRVKDMGEECSVHES